MSTAGLSRVDVPKALLRLERRVRPHFTVDVREQNPTTSLEACHTVDVGVFAIVSS